MKPYPKYRDSGVEWIGEVPEGWEVKRLKHIAKIVLGKMLTNVDKGNYQYRPYLRAQNINWERVNVEDVKKMWFSKDELHQYRLYKHDLLVSEGGEVGRTSIWNEEIKECYIQNSVHKVTMEPINDPFFFLYTFCLYGEKGVFESVVNRISIAHLTKEKLKEILFLVPPTDVQRKISKFIRSKTVQIDDLISKKKKLIELLNEERTAIINQAVTKGLNPDAPMKDSGIEWLGEIPAHWEVKRLKFLVNKVGSGVTPRGGASVYQNDGIPLIRSQNIHFDCLKLDDVAYISGEIHNEMSGSKVKPNDVLLNITGASIGRCCIVPANFGEANVNQHVCIIRPNRQIESGFLHNYISSNNGQAQIFSSEKGISREGLNFEQLKGFQILLPPINDQKDITDYIKSATTKIDQTISKIEKQIDLLKEFRTALISEVVTGKIDIRDEELK